MRTEKTETKITLFAENDMVLCDGYSATSVNGKVTAPPNADLSDWVEMTETEAEQLILANTEQNEDGTVVDPTEATEQDYIEALNDLGVDFNEEN